VLLLKLRPLLFCALYAAGQRWAAWASCIACDIAAIKLVRLVNAAVKDDLLLTHLTDSAYSAAHAHGMVDSNAMAAVQILGWQVTVVLAAKSVLQCNRKSFFALGILIVR